MRSVLSYKLCVCLCKHISWREQVDDMMIVLLPVWGRAWVAEW